MNSNTHVAHGTAAGVTTTHPLFMFNGKSFARTKPDFEAGKCDGYYRQTKEGLQLMTETKSLFAFVVISRRPRLMGAVRLAGSAYYRNNLSEFQSGRLGLSEADIPMKDSLISRAVAVFLGAEANTEGECYA